MYETTDRHRFSQITKRNVFQGKKLMKIGFEKLKIL